MQKIKNNVLFQLVLMAAVFYGIHKLAFSFLFPGVTGQFIYSLEQLYLFFGLTSLFICAVLLFIRRKEINNVGFSFLLLTFSKMGIATYFIQPVLDGSGTHALIEKYSFFGVFVVFLAIETFITAKILNKK